MLPPTFSMVHLLHRLYELDAPDIALPLSVSESQYEDCIAVNYVVQKILKLN